MISNHIILVTIIFLLIVFAAPSIVDSGELAWTIRSLPDGGCRIDFPATSAVKFVNLPPDSADVFGAGRRGTAVIVRSAHVTRVCRLNEPYDDTFSIRLNDPSTGWLELVPLVSAPSKIGSGTTGGIIVSGLDPAVRNLEIELTDLSRAIMEFQRTNRCFSCHLALPLAWAATVAEFRCLETPRTVLASIADQLVALQQADGSFAVPGRPEYGAVTPTLAAAAALAYLKKFCLDLDISPILEKAVAFLAERISTDGVPSFDFSFPPLLIGKPFAARLFLDALESLRTGDMQHPALAESRLSDLSAGAERVLNGPDDGVNKDIWRFFSISMTGEPPERAIATESASLLTKAVSSFAGERDPELLALCEGILREHGLAFEAGTIPQPDAGDLKRRIWRLYQALYRLPADR
ncbi:MAG TPA: hypothetical protein PLU72_07385 [Candidatus Ozemobacteraceae bacterium]|nr:hypothetical protein [Candidatus Ozemobacteraceae bacterium]